MSEGMFSHFESHMYSFDLYFQTEVKMNITQQDRVLAFNESPSDCFPDGGAILWMRLLPEIWDCWHSRIMAADRLQQILQLTDWQSDVECECARACFCLSLCYAHIFIEAFTKCFHICWRNIPFDIDTFKSKMVLRYISTPLLAFFLVKFQLQILVRPA